MEELSKENINKENEKITKKISIKSKKIIIKKNTQSIKTKKTIQKGIYVLTK